MPNRATGTMQEASVMVVGVTKCFSSHAALGSSAPLAYLLSEEHPAEQVSDSEEHEDHHSHDQRDQADHSEEARLVVAIVHSAEARVSPAGRRRSAIR